MFHLVAARYLAIDADQGRCALGFFLAVGRSRGSWVRGERPASGDRVLASIDL